MTTSESEDESMNELAEKVLGELDTTDDDAVLAPDGSTYVAPLELVEVHLIKNGGMIHAITEWGAVKGSAEEHEVTCPLCSAYLKRQK
jgi:hypothetical protein